MRDILVELSGVNLALGGKPVLRDLHWRIERGQSWSLTGPNGSGKSSLLKVVSGELWPDPPSRQLRRYPSFPEGHSPLSVGQRIARLSPEQQDAYLATESPLTVYEVLLGGLQGSLWPRRPPSAQELAAVYAQAQRLRIEGWLRTEFNQLSLGQRRSVLLGRALIAEPELLLLDELMEGLDPEARAGIAQAVGGFLAAGGSAVLTSHRPTDLAWTEHHLALGQVRGAERHARSAATARHPGPVTAELSGVDVALGGKLVLRELNWSLEAGTRWALTGPNGSGKSTFLMLLAGRLPAVYGSVLRWWGRERPTRSWLQQRIGYAGPDLLARTDPQLTARELIASGATGQWRSAPALSRLQEERLGELADSLQLEGLLGSQVGTLSHGQRKRTLIARALIHRPDLLLLDEPFDHLDAGVCASLHQLLERERESGMQWVISSHHPEELPPSTDHLLRLSGGKIEESASLQGSLGPTS